MAPREKGRSRRGSDEEFVLFIQGIPAHCRWQELKDLVRQTALHIRQAVVYDDNHGVPTGLGQIIVKNEEEAWRTYHRLSTNGWEGQSLVVTLSRTSSPTRPVAGPTKSPACVFPSGYVSGYSTPPQISQNMAVPTSPMSPEPVMPTTPTYPNPEYPPIMGLPPPPPSFIPVFTDALSPPPAFHATPSSTAAFCDPSSSLAYTLLPPPPPAATAAAYPLQPLPLHETPGTSVRMNGHGQQTYPEKTYNNSSSYSYSYTPRVARRTILIHNLTSSHHSTPTQNDLLALFSEAGAIEQCQIRDNANTNPNPNPTASTSTPRYYKKLSAKITFTAPEEAKRAVALFDNIVFMGSKRIRVRIDRGNPNPNPAPVSVSVSGFGSGSSGYNNNNNNNNNNNSSPSKTTNGSYEGIPNPNPKPTAAAEKPKAVVDKCQPLVVNGSGIGRDVPCC